MLEFLTALAMPLMQPYYLKCSALVVVLVLLVVPLEASIPPITRKFRLDNKYISYPMMPEHVPIGLLLFCMVIPVIIIVQIGHLAAQFRPYVLVTLLGLAISILGTMFVTDILKILIGSFRPDFIARCQPKEGLPTDQWMSVREACTNPVWHVVLEGCKSTPSGHSSLSFAGLMFVSLLLKRVRPRNSSIPEAICFTPLLLATYVAATRLIDHRHHWIDVIIGAFLGSFLSYCSWFFVVEKSFRKEDDHQQVTSDPTEV